MGFACVGAMVDAHGMSIAATSALKTMKLPPFVHPEALAAAAAQCVQFGGNEDALNAAVLAGGVIQAHMLTAAKATGSLISSTAEMPSLPAQVASFPPVPEGGATDSELSEQAKQAMAAARATNKIPQKEEDEQQPDHDQSGVQTFVPVEPLAMPSLPQQLAQMGQSLPMLPQMLLPPPMLMSALGGHSPAAASAALASAARSAAQAAAAVAGYNAPPRQLPPRGPMPMPMPIQQLPREPPQQPKPIRPPAPLVEREREVERPPPAPRPVAEVAVQEEKRKEPKREEHREEKKPAKAEDPGESLRCHLHRKPQLNCKICRRLYYSALDPTAAKKEERTKDKLTADRIGRDPDDDLNGRRRGPEPFEIANKQTYNFNAMLRDQILKNTYFKSLMNIETFEGVVDEMYQYAETAEVYGAGTTTVPSTLFCCLFRMFTLCLSYDELQQLLETRDWPYIRCCGFLYIRFGCAPEKLWEQLGDYCLDDQEFEPSKLQPNFQVTIGEYVEALLMDERYYYTALPRIPVGVKKRIEEQAAALGQYRRRTVANKKVLHLFREPSTLVEVSTDNGWMPGTVVQLVETHPTRIMVRVRLDGAAGEELQHLGKVILREKRGGPRGRSRSRSPRRRETNSPDWARHRGKSHAEMVQELRARQRERAVCSSGKDYARKPIGFMSGLALKRDMGVASTRLREEETYAPRQVEHRKQMTEEEETELRKVERDKQFQDHEKRQLMQQLYEKYGTAPPQQGPKGAQGQPTVLPGEEQPEVLRLG